MKQIKEINNVSFIVGAGAVENAWNPVIRALQPLYKIKLNADGANCIFARLVYLLRWFSSLNTEISKEQLKLYLEFTNKLKVKIASEIIKSQKSGELKARPQFDSIINKFLFSSVHKSILISTNWDTVINESINKLGQSNHPKIGSDIITNHIHGSVTNPTLLYLPTEVTREQYRNAEEDNEIGTTHGDIWRAIEQSNTSILYGLSISPLDAELSQTLACGWDSPNLKEIIIIDPDHKLISFRVKTLLKDPNRINIFGYDPNNLNDKIIYTE